MSIQRLKWLLSFSSAGAIAAFAWLAFFLGSPEQPSSLAKGNDVYLALISLPPPAPQSSAAPQTHAISAESFQDGYQPASVPASERKLIDKLLASGDSKKIKWAKVMELGWSDFRKAAALARESFPGESGEMQVAVLFSMVHGYTLQRLAENLNEIRSASQRGTLAAGLAYSWAKTQPVTLADYANENLTGEARTMTMAAIVSSLNASKQFTIAEAIVAKMPFSRDRSQALSQLASRWAQADTQAALEWAERLPVQEDTVQAMRSILGVSGVSQEKLLTIANESTNDIIRKAAVGALGNQLVKQDLAGSIKWVERLPEEYRASLQSKIAVKLAQQDLDQGTEYLRTISNDFAQERALDDVARDLVSKDPMAASRWIPKLPQHLQEMAAFSLANQWYDIDSLAASDWINGLPAGNIRDRALVAFSSRMARANPTAARELASQISDQSLRKTILSDF